MMMARILIILILLTGLFNFPADAQEFELNQHFFNWYQVSNQGGYKIMDVHDKLTNWMKANVSSQTFLPLSFSIPQTQKKMIYGRMGEEDAVRDIIERMIVEEGLCIYDGAVSQIALIMLGGKNNLSLAKVPLEIYWEGQVGHLHNIRAGYPVNSFIYDPKNPGAVSSNLADKGRRGFIFRIINAHGRYNTKDPLDGKRTFKDFPNWPTVHWEDWKPVAGENAWVVMAAMHLYHKKYYDVYQKKYHHPADSVELKLAEEIARAALILQAKNGGIRMAPIGTYRNPEDCVNKAEREGAWWYRQISTENNLSWYAALRMLHKVTNKPVYKRAMLRIENYFKAAWNRKGNYFYQGMHYVNGRWELNDQHFALDVQSWGIDVLGPARIDRWFGEGAAWRLWQKAKTTSGCYDEAGNLLGVGFIAEHDRLSVEWTAGAIFAVRAVAAYYKGSEPQWSRQALSDGMQMRKGIETLQQDLSFTKAAYAYSSRRGWIPFGWFSHESQVLSLTSTGWVLFVDYQFNPFLLPSHQNNFLQSARR